MTRFSLVGFYRSLMRHRLYAALNVGGLAVGIAVVIVLGLYVRFETGYERWLPGHGQIYLVESRTSDDNADLRARQSTPAAAWDAISRDLPDTVGTRIVGEGATVVKNGIGVREQLSRVDQRFFQVFRLQVLAGDAERALSDPSAIIISEDMARKYFGSPAPIGRMLSVTFRGEAHLYRVAAVIANMPANTDLQADLVTRYIAATSPGDKNFKNDHQWNYTGPRTYVRLRDGGAARQFEADLAQVVARHAQSETPDEPGYSLALTLRPFTDVHFETPGSALAVRTLGMVGLLTLLIALVNYINLATALGGLRAREVAMRKVLGANRRTLALHYVGESVATSAMAALLGLAIAEAGLSLVNTAAGLHLVIRYVGSDGVLLPLAFLVLIVGVLAGFYPALVLSRVPAAAVLVSARAPGGGRAGTRVREALVVAQFAIAIAFVIGTLVMVAQTRHVRAADVGFERDHLLLVRSLASSSLDDAQRASIVHRLAGLPNVRAISIGNTAPGGGFFTSSSNFSVPGFDGPGPSIQFFETTPGFFKVVNARLLAGRLFDQTHGSDANANLAVDGASNGKIPTNVVLNMSAVKALHYLSAQDAVGKSFGGSTPKIIIGVVEDMRFDSPRNPVVPIIYDFTLRSPSRPIAVLRFRGDERAMMDAVRDAWSDEVPQVPFETKTAAQALELYYRADDHTARLFTIGALLAVAIGCVGLWGLASFNTARRTHEIGVRKTLGATSGDIARLLVSQFLRPVLVANAFAWPLAWIAMRAWLAGFNDRIMLTPTYFVAATIIGLVIAVLTVLAQSLRAARAAPSWALRHH